MSRPKLSVLVVAYQMARELPRTIRSLSPAMQRGISADDYELLVLDNGSTPAVDAAACRRLAPNLRLEVIEDAPPSPVAAINRGLALARGDLIGVCIDGARMASPGLLRLALEAAALASKPVIGSIAFHLGPDVQPRTVLRGYDQSVEDDLLCRANWSEDGYRLFGISVFAESSRNGWFELPHETNALFLPRAHWDELRGYDAGFVSPGGGLANLDAWKRACESPGATVILLQGEATFHQVHGGIATNAKVSPAKEFHDEYLRVRGERYQPPRVQPRLYGSYPEAALPSVRVSLRRAEELARERAAARDATSTPTAAGRPFRSNVDPAVWDAIQIGVMRSTYRGVACHKSPFDLALYARLIGTLRPPTVIEIGSKAGGSALWFADTLTAHGIAGPRVVSIDLSPGAKVVDPRIEFLRGDARALGATLSDARLRAQPHPWLVVEDSSHRHDDVLAVLEFFDRHLAPGDYVVVEDGIVSQLTDPLYATFEDGPNRAVARFLSTRAGRYDVDTELCDFYGFNATYNPNGWLRRKA